MKFKQAIIYGFGKWVDKTISFPNTPFIYIYGENEAGKSTLQTFILFMLFGMYPKERAFYHPKTSSKMGGKLTIVDPDNGEFIIERFDHVRNGKAICHTKEGEKGEEWLNNYLQGMTMDNYRAIFSFSASDLLSNKQIRATDLSDILLSIGLTGSAQLYTIDKKIDQELNDLFKPYGKKPKINQQLKRIKQLTMKRNEAEQEINQYRSQKEGLERTKQEVKTLQAALQKEREALLLIERKLQALPYVRPYQKAKEGLYHLNKPLPFPENGVERLQLLKDKQIPIESEYAIYKKNAQSLQATIKHLEYEQNEMIWIDDIQNLLEKKADYYYLLQEIEQIAHEIQEKNIRLQTEMRYLNISISEAELLELEFPFQTEKKWIDIKERFERLQTTRKQFVMDKQALMKKMQQLQDEKKALQYKQLSKKERIKLESLLEREKETSYRKEIKRQRKHIISQKQQTEKKQRSFLWFSLFIGLICMMIAFFQSSSFFTVGGFLGMFFSLFFWIWHRNTVADLRMLFSWEENQQKQLLTEEEGNEIKKQLMQDDHIRLRLANINESIDMQAIHLKMIEDKFSNWKLKEVQLDEDIANEQDTYPFLIDADVEDWPVLYHSLKHLLLIFDEIEQAREKMTAKEKRRHQFEEELEKLFCSIENKEVDTVSNMLHVLEKKKAQYEKNQADLKSNRKKYLEAQKQIEYLKEHLKYYKKEREVLFTLARVQSEDEFYRRKADKEKKESFEQTIQQIRTQFSPIFSNKEWEAFIAENKTEQALMVIQDDKTNRITAMERDVERNRQVIATYEAQLEKIETSESYSTLMHQIQLEKEQLESLSKRWSVLTTAKAMLEETIEIYQETYLEQVIYQATLYFTHITGGAYQKIIAPTNQRPFLVETKQKNQYSVHELSQGTIDQLFISLRLAIGEIIGGEKNFPFILDDAFVHFDKVRFQRILEVLKDVSKKRQLIFFTCHDSISEKLEEQVGLHAKMTFASDHYP